MDSCFRRSDNPRQTKREGTSTDAAIPKLRLRLPPVWAEFVKLSGRTYYFFVDLRFALVFFLVFFFFRVLQPQVLHIFYPLSNQLENMCKKQTHYLPLY